MNEIKWKEVAEKWVNDSEDTNDYCERSLMVAALNAIENNDLIEAKRRLLQLLPSGSQLVDVPNGRVE